MSVTVSKNCFSGKAQALQAIGDKGLFPRDGAMSAGDLEDVHWHKTSLEIYVLEGSFETRDGASGMSLLAGPGDLISIPAGTLHAARCPEPARYVVGFESEAAMASFKPEPPEDLK